MIVCVGGEREKEKVKGNEVEGVQTDIRRGGGGQCEQGEVEMVGERESPPLPTPPRCALNAVDSQMARLQQVGAEECVCVCLCVCLPACLCVRERENEGERYRERESMSA